MKRIAAIVLCAFALLSASAAAAAAGATYANRPVRLLVGFAPGGSDVPARMLSAKLGERLGQPVVVDNRPGASSVLATDILTKAPPDGHTLMFSTASHAVTAVYYRKLPYDPIRDISPVSFVGSVPFVLLVHPSSPATSVREFVALAKSKPGQLNYGSPGTGSIGHLAHVLFAKQAGIEVTHVGYKGTGPAVTALLTGEIQFYMPNLIGALPHVRAGKLRALGVTAAQRSPLASDIPTIAEGGVRGVEADTWYGVIAPRGTPQPIVDTLNREIVAILKTQAFRDQLGTVGVVAEASSPQQFASFIRSEIEKWGAVMRFAGMAQESY